MPRKMLLLPLVLFALAACGSAIDFRASKMEAAVGTWHCSGDRVLEAAIDRKGSAVLRDPAYGYGVEFLYSLKGGDLEITYKSSGSSSDVSSVLSLDKVESSGLVTEKKLEGGAPGALSLGETGAFKVKFISDIEVHFSSTEKGSIVARCYKDSPTPDFAASTPSEVAALTLNSHILSRAHRDKSSVFSALTKVGKEDPGFLNDFTIKVGAENGTQAWPKAASAKAPDSERLLQISDDASGVSVCVALGEDPTIKSPRRLKGWSLLRASKHSSACAGAILPGLTASNNW